MLLTRRGEVHRLFGAGDLAAAMRRRRRARRGLAPLGLILLPPLLALLRGHLPPLLALLRGHLPPLLAQFLTALR